MTGNYRHNMDAKGRVFMPAPLRDSLGDTFRVTRGLGPQLYAYAVSEFDKILTKIENAMTLGDEGLNNFARWFVSNAFLCELDAQGRILVPPSLRDYAKLEKEVVITGHINRAEIWSASAWDAFDIMNQDPEGMVHGEMMESVRRLRI
ncbi:division/cell wall cluster transcriptional repressor MraZ [Eubacteriales bacterium OttesenSCG-928-M02]|nr:division/cell wall cluster transcriptional repressor MraZ [Eubacteriales bacterium OttesenSCG-928-M02]